MKKNKLILILVLLFFTLCTSSAAERMYSFDKLLINDVDFKITYKLRIRYSEGAVTVPQLLPYTDFSFDSFTDDAGYVEDLSVDGTTVSIKFRRRDKTASINGSITFNFFAKPETGADEMVRYTLLLPYTYTAMSSVDPGEIKGPSKCYKIGERPDRIISLYEALPLEGETITYSWERKQNGVWCSIENATSSSLYPEPIGVMSEYYRRKAIDSSGNSAYSNTVEILPVLTAGEIDIHYTDENSTLTLSNSIPPNSVEAVLNWQSSADLDVWVDLPDTTMSITIDKPLATTYYRRVITTQAGDEYGNPIVKHSNIVCYNLSTPAGIASKTYWSHDSVVTDFEYVDGLGRIMQTVAKSATMTGEDIVTAYIYDKKGRETGATVPFAISGDGRFVKNAFYKSKQYHNDDFAFTHQFYENSPLDRPLGSYKPGAVYQGTDKHSSTVEYDVNKDSELLKLIHTHDGFVVTGMYPAATLRKTIVLDEDDSSVTLFVDAFGKTLLERRNAGNGQYADTYFVYDAMERLAVVVSPQGSRMLCTGTMYSNECALSKNYCYVYTYDSDNRVTMKRLPGCCSRFFEYDTNGRLTVSYDEEMLQSGVKKHFAYDAIGRVVGFRYAGENGACCQQRSLYDVYDANCSSFVAVDGIVAESDLASSVKGLLTYERTFEIYSEWASEVRERTYYYDKRGRCIQATTLHPIGVNCRTSIKYDYNGNPLMTLEEYSGIVEPLAILTERTFDSRGRKLTEQTRVNGAVVGYAAFTYDEQGRMTETRLNEKINITAGYNLQGWLTHSYVHTVTDENEIERPLFYETLRYYSPTDSLSIPRYTGKISEQEWQRTVLNDNSDRYIYCYDIMGRLINAEHRIVQGTTESTAGSYNAEFTYDLAGNILSHNTDKDGASYQLHYTYNGNSIVTVTRNGTTLGAAQYDSRGNITKIPGENLQIAYNLSNLPQSITTADGTKIDYSYLSDGTKFRAVSETGVNYLYTGSLRWRLQDGTLVPESFAIIGGRVICNNGSWQTNYYITDHLGSVRTVTDASGNVLAEFDYTPYGELLSATDNTAGGTDYLFTGKERQEKLGVGELYDSGARFMGTAGRFHSIDPLAEKYYHLSPYAYCAGDPVNLVDPDGRKIYFADGVPEWFKERFAATIQYMNERGTSWIFKKLQDSDEVYYIQYTQNRKIGYMLSKKTIYWNPNAFSKNTNGTIVFPATILAHEGRHALQHDEYGEEKYKELKETADPEYGDLIEKEVITTTEQVIAKLHSDIEEEETTRTDHKGKIFVMDEYLFMDACNESYTAIPERFRENILEYLRVIWNIGE